jgi:exodeoxyribonuclease VII large subunit
MAAALRRAADRLAAATGGRLGQAARDLAVERRALDRVSPAARLATAREQVGLLFDRGSRVVEARLARERLVLRAAAEALPRLGTARVVRDRQRVVAAQEALPRLVASRVHGARAALDASAAALAVLGPAATLERGYAIVRVAADGSIVRDPATAPAGTKLAVRVAHGELDAVVTD